MQKFQLTGDAVTGLVTSAAEKSLAQSLPTTVSFGRIRPDPDIFQAKLAKEGFQNPTATPPPAMIDYSPKAMESLSKMHSNDVLGCCVISAVAHAVGTWSGNDKTCLVATEPEIRDAYAKLAYRPGTDSGCVITDVLDHMKSTGIGSCLLMDCARSTDMCRSIG